jgi:hypothetical protein
MHKCVLVIFTFFSLQGFSQGAFTAIGTAYTQNFNSLPNVTDGSTMAGWTQNGTLPGWYIDEGNAGATCGGTACDDLPTIEATYTTINNGGNSYAFASGSDRSLGSRSAGSTGTIFFGVRLVNNTGTTITSVYIDYYGEQWSIAENQTNVNTITLEYQTGATVTSLTAGSWTATGSNFTQIYTSSQSSGMGGSACAGTSAQCLALDGNAGANRVHISGCISVNIPVNQEIMLRWSDVNDPANDHHMQIDDVSIYPFDVSCATVLPVTWSLFTAERAGNTSLLHWETSSEENNDYFAVERLNENGYYVELGTVDGHGTTSQPNQYDFTDESPYSGTNYYRIRQVDFNGQYNYSVIRTVEFSDAPPFDAFTSFDGSLHFTQIGNVGTTMITVYADDGRIQSRSESDSPSGILETPRASGVYFIRFENAEGTVVVKQLIIL